MTHKEAFAQIMRTTENMALATSVQGMPNVRIVTFAYAGRRQLTKNFQKTTREDAS